VPPLSPHQALLWASNFLALLITKSFLLLLTAKSVLAYHMQFEQGNSLTWIMPSPDNEFQIRVGSHPN
jgi:cytochrome c-type biogenesis protein CcmH/NrfF